MSYRTASCYDITCLKTIRWNVEIDSLKNEYSPLLTRCVCETCKTRLRRLYNHFNQHLLLSNTTSNTSSSKKVETTKKKSKNINATSNESGINNLSSKIAELVRLEIQRQTAVSVEDDDVESDDIQFASNSKQTSVNKNGGQKQRQHTKKSNIQPIDSFLLNPLRPNPGHIRDFRKILPVLLKSRFLILYLHLHTKWVCAFDSPLNFVETGAKKVP